jgi:hypothetical protein
VARAEVVLDFEQAAAGVAATGAAEELHPFPHRL